jgi:hypothetical protein
MAPQRPAVPRADVLPNEVGLLARIDARYEVLERLGRGGMAAVFRVRDTSHGGVLALKQLSVDATADREAKALFEREFYTLAQLSHPSVIEVYDFGVDSAGPYYTMELLDGADLNARAPLDYLTVCKLMLQVCSSLLLLHARRLVHRDVTPRNVRCTRDGHAKLIDFGAMAPMGPCARSVGTPTFIAPESLLHLSLDARTDLFSLGATMYFALTGRVPFPVRAFAELREAWGRDPVAPSQLADMPPALEALVMALLSIDPARRPSSAAEVMQRLSAIAGIESEGLSRAQLATPTLIGREPERRRFVQHVRRATQGQGGGLCIESAPGLGRSRLLGACLIEAKTLGATVLHVAGGASIAQPFGAVQSLLEQLLEALPDVASQAAAQSDAIGTLFTHVEPQSDTRILSVLPLAESTGARHALRSALASFVLSVCRARPLVIAVDDVDRIDDASLASLAALAHAARDSRLLLLVTLQRPTQRELLALQVLRNQCAVLELAPLSAAQTEALFASVFGNVAQLALVSERIYTVAGGSPRESLALAQHLHDRLLIRYRDGNWILPAELALSDLPANVEEALRARIAVLPALSRRLLEAQALDLVQTWRRADYCELAGEDQATRIDDALGALLRQGFIVSDGPAYSLASHAARASVVAMLAPQARQLRHEQLAQLCVRVRRPGLMQVHHALLAGRVEQALARLAQLLEELGDHADFSELSGMEAKDIASTFRSAFDAAIASGRPAREIHELARRLVTLSVAADTRLHQIYGPAWLAQLKRDSGWSEYLALADEPDQARRLQRALQHTAAQHDTTPERERVYRPDEAIRYLARYEFLSVVVARRRLDAELSASLAGLLEPFAGLSAVTHALWQHALWSDELRFTAKPECARVRGEALGELLNRIPGDELRYLETIRGALDYSLGCNDILLGQPSAVGRIERMAQDPEQQVPAGYLRRLLCIYRGDSAGAERERRHTELLALQTNVRQLFDPPLHDELIAYVHAGDLAGVKQVADRIAQCVAESRGWLALHHLAQGCFQRLRGDFGAARGALEDCLAISSPDLLPAKPCLTLWVHAAAAYVGVLVELGQPEQARSFGLRALERCAELEIGALAQGISRELSLCEAKLGAFASAAQRVDALIAARAGLMASHLAVDYEARAWVAVLARDTDAVIHYTALAGQLPLDSASTLSVRRGQLLRVARRAGLAISLPVSQFESSVLGEASPLTASPALSQIGEALTSLQEPSVRAERALQLLLRSVQGARGQLYLFQYTVLRHVALVNMACDPALDDFVRHYWQQQLEDLGMTAPVTLATQSSIANEIGSWTNPRGVQYQVLMLKANVDAGLVPVGLVAWVRGASRTSVDYAADAVAVSTRLLELGDACGYVDSTAS